MLAPPSISDVGDENGVGGGSVGHDDENYYDNFGSVQEEIWCGVKLAGCPLLHHPESTFTFTCNTK